MEDMKIFLTWPNAFPGLESVVKTDLLTLCTTDALNNLHSAIRI